MHRKVFDFEWSLKPAILWMSLFGIRINGFGKMPVLLRKVIGFLGLVVFFCILSVHITALSRLIQEVIYYFKEQNLRKNQLVRSISPIYISLVNCLFSLGPHTILFLFSSLGSLKSTWENLIEIHGKLELNGAFYRKVRRQCCIGLGLLCVVSFKPQKKEDLSKFKKLNK